jgi:hypothetical protein
MVVETWLFLFPGGLSIPVVETAFNQTEYVIPLISLSILYGGMFVLLVDVNISFVEFLAKCNVI